MGEKKMEPNAVTNNVFFKWYCKEGKMDEASERVWVMEESGVPPDNTLINGYCNAGNLSLSSRCMSTDSWRSTGSGFHDYKILAFNLGTEVFHLIDSPCSESCGQLLPLHDRITIRDTHLLPDIKVSNEIWVMNDEGYWTKVLKIEHVLEVEQIFGFWKHGKVLVESASGQLLLYDLESEEAKELGIQTREGGDFLEVYTSEESLAAIGKE
ncbi:hypothetical protein PTKIN_Ptkin16aG0475300 [Pterospermum kingtungense]